MLYIILVVLVAISICTAIGAWQWLVDPETMQVSFLQSLYNHLFFTLSSVLLGNVWLNNVLHELILLNVRDVSSFKAPWNLRWTILFISSFIVYDGDPQASGVPFDRSLKSPAGADRFQHVLWWHRKINTQTKTFLVMMSLQHLSTLYVFVFVSHFKLNRKKMKLDTPKKTNDSFSFGTETAHAPTLLPIGTDRENWVEGSGVD